ncbi:phage tail tape measure protein [Moraxella nonliquefaciens]|uniref:phage tail tape measure protein n=1 Tax=Moraxella nonliquefaciens TaxID=478 RepID=UPI0024A6C39F|nr:phage tail tape measure protein [Moraxella nonliquefaciens]MDI4497563.1 phage tail tape measure protein [Moraxella nonliquefaciens]MDI4499664.1 phage tail tape measure protein [Moraxella nonliquefaciens]
MATELSIVISASAMIGGAMSAIRTLTGGLDSVRRSSNILGNEQRRLRGEIDRLGGSSAVPALQRQYERLGRTMRDLRMNAVQQAGIQTRLENNRQARADMQGEIMGLVGAGFTLSVPIKLAIDFESAMADVKKVVDFGDNPILAKQGVEALSSEILRLSSIRPMSATDIANIVALGGQSGIAKEQLMQFADSAVKMGVAFDISAQQAGQSMAELRSAFQLDQKGVETLADKINYLGNTTPAAAKSIMEIVQRVGAFGEVAGYSTGTVAVLGASMKGFGIAEEVAATSIKNMMLSLVAGETATKGQISAWKKLGFDHEQVAKDMQTNAEGTTLAVLKAISKLDKHEQASALKELFGSESLLGIAPLLANLGLIEERLAGIKNASNFDGSMNKEYEVRAETTANNIQLLKNNMAHLGIAIGSVVLPALNGLINDIKPVIESVIGFAKANPVLVATLFKVVAALFAFKVGSLGVRFAFSLLSSGLLSVIGIGVRTAGTVRMLSGAFTLFKMGRAVSALRLFGLSARQARTAISLFTGGFNLIRSGATGFVSILSKIMAFARLFGSSLVSVDVKVGQAFMMIGRVIAIVGRAMLTNPIVLIGMLIAGVAYLIYKNWDTIKPMLIGFWQSITQAANGVWQWLVGIWSGFTTWFGGLWTGITAWAGNAWTAITTGASIAWGWLVGIWGGAVAWFSGLWTSVQAVAVGVWTGITGFIGSVWANIRDLVSAGVQGLMAVIRGFSPVSAFSTAFLAVWGFLSGLVGRFRTFGVNIIQGLIGGIKSMAGAVVGAISSTVGNVAGTAKRMLGINSPSRVFRQFGSWVSEGLAIGIDKGGQKPVSAIGSVASGVTANFGAKMGNLSAQISTSVGEHQARMTNANATNSQSQGNITIHFNPTINAGGGDVGKIERALQISQAEFEKMFARMQQDKLRRAY